MPKWENFGRITRIDKGYFRRSRKQVVEVKTIFWLAEFNPPYAYGDYLFYETGDATYKIYNPLQYNFALEQLMQYQRAWHALHEGQDILRYEVVASES